MGGSGTLGGRDDRGTYAPLCLLTPCVRDPIVRVMRNETPIAAAVLPLKSEAISRAEQEAQKVVESVREQLEAAGHDVRVAAPYPNGGLSRGPFMLALGKYLLFSALTVWRKTTYGMNEPMLADVTDERVERFIKEAKENAAKEYDLFVAKLEEKIGTCASAELTGNHVWSHSILTIKKEDETIERWKTQMIVNCSKLGKLFNQFPTRKVK